MMRDAHVRRSIALRTDPILAAEWDFDPASQSPIDIEIADFCSWVFFEANDWRRVLKDILRYHRDGFSLIEPTDDVRPVAQDRFPNHPGRGQGIIYTGFHYRPANTLYRWLQSPTDPTQISGIEQWLLGSDEEDAGTRFIPAERLIRFTEDQEGANFAGLSTLRSAYGAWKIKLAMQIILAIKHERQGLGIPTITTPENAPDEDFETAEDILREIRASDKGYIVLPFGFVFDWKTANGGDTRLLETIQWCDQTIAHNVGGGFTVMGTNEQNHGSYALATTQTDPYEISLDQDAAFVATRLLLGSDGWSPVRRLVDLNYGPQYALPIPVARNMPTRDWADILPVVHNLGISGFLTPDDVTEDQIRRVLKMCQRDPKTARERAAPKPTTTGGDNNAATPGAPTNKKMNGGQADAAR